MTLHLCSPAVLVAVPSADHTAISLLDPQSLLRWLGPYVLVGLCAIVFAECGF